MGIINQPTNLFASPFAQNGDKTVIPLNGGEAFGLASLDVGFPPVTQKPLIAGGVAPNRKDFNGILNMMSAYSFYAQSGGIFTWNSALNYSTPAIIAYQGKLYWCLVDSGPGTSVGAKPPSIHPDYWADLFTALADMVVSGGSTLFNPVGLVSMFYGTTAPTGWLALNGASFSPTQYPKLYALLKTNILPNFAGYVPRGYDPTGVVDPDGTARSIGSLQGDAIRNITGQFRGGTWSNQNLAGVFTMIGDAGYGTDSGPDRTYVVNFDASKQVPTAPENRMKNFSILYCIKHD